MLDNSSVIWKYKAGVDHGCPCFNLSHFSQISPSFGLKRKGWSRTSERSTPLRRQSFLGCYTSPVASSPCDFPLKATPRRCPRSTLGTSNTSLSSLRSSSYSPGFSGLPAVALETSAWSWSPSPSPPSPPWSPVSSWSCHSASRRSTRPRCWRCPWSCSSPPSCPPLSPASPSSAAPRPTPTQTQGLRRRARRGGIETFPRRSTHRSLPLQFSNTFQCSPLHLVTLELPVAEVSFSLLMSLQTRTAQTKFMLLDFYG